jgi:hypothetical protein
MRFYKDITIEVYPNGLDTRNIINRQELPSKVDTNFNQLYKNHFINYRSVGNFNSISRQAVLQQEHTLSRSHRESEHGSRLARRSEGERTSGLRACADRRLAELDGKASPSNRRRQPSPRSSSTRC